MVSAVNASHAGSCLSAADILAVLYTGVLCVRPGEPAWPERDRFILSKGHAAAALYAALAHAGYFARDMLWDYCRNGSLLTGHASHAVPGVEMSTGSLGHGLSLGLGMALAARIDGSPARTFVLLSDGECDEGAVWEAAMFAGHHQVDNLVAIIDYNRLQSFGRVEDVLELEPFADKWRAMRWSVRQIDGHDHAALVDALAAAPNGDAPAVVICNTVKGKGVSYMEDRLEWHYRSPNAEQLAQALAEILR
jgi:transketolase